MAWKIKRKLFVMFILLALLFITLRAASAELAAPASVQIGPESAERGTTVYGNFVLTNTDANQSVDGITISGSADTEYNLLFSLDNSAYSSSVTLGSLAPNGSFTVYLKAYIPNDEDSGSHDFADISIAGMQDSETIRTVTVSPKSYLSISSVEVDGDDLDESSSVDIQPDTEVEFEVTVENLFGDIEIKDVEVELTIFDIRSGNGDITEMSERSDIDADEDESFVITASIPDWLENDDYDITVEVIGIDENDARHTALLSGKLNADKEEHQLKLEADLSADEVSCMSSLTLYIKVKNLGSSDEDDVRITAFNSALGLSEIMADLEIDENEDYSASVDISAYGAKPGKYRIDISAEADSGDELVQESLILNVKECSESSLVSQSVREDQIRAEHQKLLESILASMQPAAVDGVDGIDGAGNVYENGGSDRMKTAIFWVIGAVDFGIILFLVMILALRRKRRKQESQQALPKTELPAAAVLKMKQMNDGEHTDRSFQKPRLKRTK